MQDQSKKMFDLYYESFCKNATFRNEVWIIQFLNGKKLTGIPWGLGTYSDSPYFMFKENNGNVHTILYGDIEKAHRKNNNFTIKISESKSSPGIWLARIEGTYDGVEVGLMTQGNDPLHAILMAEDCIKTALSKD